MESSPSLETLLQGIYEKSIVEDTQNEALASFIDIVQQFPQSEIIQEMTKQLGKRSSDNNNEELKLLPLLFLSKENQLTTLSSLITFLQQNIQKCNASLHAFIAKVFGQIIYEFYQCKPTIQEEEASYDILLKFCLEHLKDEDKNYQVYSLLLFVELLENCPLIKKAENIKLIWTTLSGLLEDKSYSPKHEVLNCIIGLIFATEGDFHMFAYSALFKMMDFLADNDWLIRKLALNVVYTLGFYCKEEIMPLKDNIIEFLNVLRHDKVKEVQEVCLQIYEFFPGQPGSYMNTISQEPNMNTLTNDKAAMKVGKNEITGHNISPIKKDANQSHLGNSICYSDEKKEKAIAKGASTEKKKNKTPIKDYAVITEKRWGSNEKPKNLFNGEKSNPNSGRKVQAPIAEKELEKEVEQPKNMGINISKDKDIEIESEKSEEIQIAKEKLKDKVKSKQPIKPKDKDKEITITKGRGKDHESEVARVLTPPQKKPITKPKVPPKNPSTVIQNQKDLMKNSRNPVVKRDSFFSDKYAGNNVPIKDEKQNLSNQIDKKNKKKRASGTSSLQTSSIAPSTNPIKKKIINADYNTMGLKQYPTEAFKSRAKASSTTDLNIQSIPKAQDFLSKESHEDPKIPSPTSPELGALEMSIAELTIQITLLNEKQNNLIKTVDRIETVAKDNYSELDSRMTHLETSFHTFAKAYYETYSWSEIEVAINRNDTTRALTLAIDNEKLLIETISMIKQRQLGKAPQDLVENCLLKLVSMTGNKKEIERIVTFITQVYNEKVYIKTTVKQQIKDAINNILMNKENYQDLTEGCITKMRTITYHS